MKTTLPEIFDAIQKASTKEEKLQIIRDEYSVSLVACLKMLFDPTIYFNLPKGIPDDFVFNTHPYNSLERMIRSIPPLVALPAGAKLEKAWLRLLVPLSKEEVVLLTALKDKDLETGLTKADVQKLFPTLFADLSPEALADLESKKAADSAEAKLADTGSETPEPVVIPDDPYGDAFKAKDESKTEEVFGDEGQKSEIVVEVPEELEDDKEEASKPAKKAAKKTPAKKG